MKRRLTVLVLLVAGCAGRSILENSRDEADGGRSAGATGGASANAPSQGAANGTGAIGSATPGGAPMAGTRGMGRGGRAGVGTGTTGGRDGAMGGAASGGASGAARSGGTSGSVSAAGAADVADGAGGAGAAGAAGQPDDDPVICMPTVLSGFRCENALAYGQSSTMQEVVGASSAGECLAACEANPSCTAVSTYFTLIPPGGCIAADGNCSPPVVASWHEEDGGLVYQRGTCGSDGECPYTAVGFDRCASTTFHPENSLEACFDYCDADSACTNVVDYTYLASVAGRCFLNLSTCDAPVQTHEDGVLYLRCGTP